MAVASSTSPLMDLLGELCNNIYRFALPEEEQVTRAGLSEPGILSVCKEIRKEAGPLFYAETEFDLRFNIPWDVVVARRFTEKMLRALTEFKDVMSNQTLTGPLTAHWKNLTACLRELHQKECFVFRTADEDDDAETLVAISMLKMVDALREMPWSQVEAIVEEQRKALVRLNSAWAD